MKLQVIATPDGDIVWVSGPLPGAVHDLTAARIWGHPARAGRLRYLESPSDDARGQPDSGLHLG
jgi:hypothetical protein